MSIHTDGLLNRFTREVTALHQEGRVISLHLEVQAAVCLVGQLQLAMRHTRNTGASRGAARWVIARIREQFEDCPAILEGFRRGDDPAYDVPATTQEPDHES